MPIESDESELSSEVVTGSGGLKDKKRFSLFRMALLIVPISVVGIFLLYHSHAASVPPLSIRVSGNHFVNQIGTTTQLRGVNYSGTEYACVASGDNIGYTTDPTLHGNGAPKEGTQLPYADTVAQNFLKWDKAGAAGHAINTVRIPLNEGCWLGTNGVSTTYSGTNYQTFIKRLVDKLTAQGMYVVLDDHWSGFTKDASGAVINQPSNSQNVGPTDNAPAFWSSVASTYKGYSNVLFDLFNEPGFGCPGVTGCINPTTYPADPNQARAWDVYINGGTYTYAAGNNGARASDVGKTIKTPGIQSILTNNIRAVGATNPVIVETLGWGSGYLEQMGQRLPVDPLAATTTGSQIAASFHDYKTGVPSADWDATLSRSLSTFPIFIGEYSRAADCTANATWANNTFAWFDQHGYSHTAWAWDSNKGCEGVALVTDPSGNDTGETTAMGALVKTYLQSHQSDGVTSPPVDTSPPTVALGSPQANSIVGGTYNFAATASDNVGVTKIDFKVDGVVVNTDTSSPYSYAWNSSTVSNGAHTVSATAYDAAGNSQLSSATVTVTNTTPPSDTTPPSISLTSPTSGAELTGNTVKLAATASDNVGVSRVDFKVDSDTVTTNTASPYSVDWDSSLATNGSHTVSAIAYDAAGNSKVASLNVNVNNTTAKPDTTAPSAITQLPIADATLRGVTSLSGTADGTGSTIASIRVCAGCSSDSAASGATITKNGNLASWSYSLDTTKLPNGANSIIVWVTDSAGNKGGAETAVLVQNGDTAPPNVTNVNLQASATSATKTHLAWTAATDNVGVTGYFVVRGGITIAQLGNVTSYDDTTVVAATTYSYQLIARDAQGNNSAATAVTKVTTPTIPDTTAPSTPTGLKATAVSTTQINLSWTAATDAGGSGLKGYNVYRNGTKITTTPITTTSFGATGLTPNTSYTYAVSAIDGAGNNSQNSTAAAKTLTTTVSDTQPPIWPAGSRLTINPVNYHWWQGACSYKTSCYQTLSWTAATDDTKVASYSILRGTNGSSLSTIGVVNAPSMSFNDSPIDSGTSYSYKIVAKDAAGNSANGPTVTKSVSCFLNFCQ